MDITDDVAVTKYAQALVKKKLRTVITKWEWNNAVSTQIEELARSIKRLIAWCFLMGMAGFGCNVYAEDILWLNRSDLDNSSELSVNLLKVLSLILTWVYIVLLIRIQFLEYTVLQMKAPEQYGDSGFLTTPQSKWRLVGTVLCAAVQPYPGMNRATITLPWGLAMQDCTYNLDVFLCIAMFLCRAHLIGLFAYSQSPFWMRRPLFTSSFQLIDPTDPFVFYRYYHTMAPVRLHLGSIGIYLATSAYMLYVFERAADDWHRSDPDWATLAGAPSSLTPISYWSSLWFQIVTAGTVGYGQYTVHTFAGRAIAVITVCYGVMCVGFAVSAVEGQLCLTHQEGKVLAAVQDRQERYSYEDHAASLIQCVWVVRQRAQLMDIEGFAKREWIFGQTDSAVQRWKSHRKQYIMAGTRHIRMTTTMEKLHGELQKAASKQHRVDDHFDVLFAKQSAMQIQMEKSEQRLSRLSDRLGKLTEFFESMPTKQ